MNPVEEHVIPKHEAPQAGVHVIRQRAPQARKIRQHPDSIAKILQQTPSRSRILFPDEIEELRDPLQGGIGPDDLVGQLLVAFQEASHRLFMRGDPAGLDVCQAPVGILEELDFIEKGSIALDVHENRRILPFLRHDDRAPGAPYLFEDTLDTGPQFRDGDVFKDIVGLSRHKPYYTPLGGSHDEHDRPRRGRALSHRTG